MMPVDAPIASPAGRPETVQVRAVALSSSAAGTASETGLPAVVTCAPGLPTTIVFLAVQVKDAEPVAVVASVTVTLTVPDEALVIVPEIRPVALPIASPAGRPVAL